jgi:hypothetical protein
MRGRIYKIYSNDGDKVYIGLTLRTLEARFKQHKKDFIRFLNKKTINYLHSYDVFKLYGILNCKIELIEEIESENKQDLFNKEQFYINKYKQITTNNNNLNLNFTELYGEEQTIFYLNFCKDKKKEYYEANREQIKEYYIINKEHLQEQKRIRYKANKEHIHEQNIIRYKQNKEHINEQNRIRYKQNKEKISKQKKEYYEANKQKLKEQAKEYYKANKEQKKEYYKDYYKQKKELKILN